MTNNIFDPGVIPVGVQDALANPLGDSGISLPFPAPVVWWKNGEKKMKSVGGVEYFGGWAIGAEELDNLNLEPPEGWKLLSLSGKSGDFDVYTSRFIGFAPIAKRQRWDAGDSGVMRSTVHILGVGAVWSAKDNRFLPYGAVVLSAKGWASRYLQDALKQFDSASRDARKTLAGGLPANFFYAPIGTFGENPNYIAVGKGEQSFITPPECRAIETWNVETLNAMYLGGEVLNAAVEWRREAQEWLDAWKDGKGERNGGRTPETTADDLSKLPF